MPHADDNPYSPPRQLDWGDRAQQDSEIPTLQRYRLLAFLCVAAAVAYIGRSCLGVASDTVQKSLGIDDVVWMSAAMSAFFWGYALSQIPAGWIGQRWGTRRALTLYAIVWSVACALIGGSIGLWMLIAMQLIFGIAQAGIFPCSAAAISKWLPTSRRAFATGSLGSFMSIGGAAGVALTGFLLTEISWRWIFVLFALPGFVWAAAFYRWFRNRPQDHPGVNSAELAIINADKKVITESDNASTPWAKVLLSRDMWLICGQQFFRAAGQVFYATWFPKFLKETYGVSTKESGLLASLPLLAIVAGALLGGVLVDWIWNRTGSRRLSRQLIGAIAMVVCAVMIALAYFVEQATPAVLLIAVGSFFASLAGPCAYTVTIEKAGKSVAPIFGLMNMCGNLGAAVCPLAVGLFVKLSGGKWQFVLPLFVGNYIVAAICWALLNPNGNFEEPQNRSNSE
jgi:ACS family D-galactonate transporter-like MFS transporter